MLYADRGLSNVLGGMMNRIKHYTDMEARYRKQADAEPARREKHIADAEVTLIRLDKRQLH